MIIGLTGMSGAGKTTVCEVFRQNDFEIIDCDLLSRTAVKKDTPCLKELADIFGEDILIDGELDRKKLGNIVFSDAASLNKLNDTIFPYISYLVLDMIRKSEKAFILLDAPTLFESGIDFICDRIVSVVCDRDISADRIMRRDGIDKEQAEKRLSSQHTPEHYIEKSDISIYNNSDLQQLLKKADEAAKRIKSGEI